MLAVANPIVSRGSRVKAGIMLFGVTSLTAVIGSTGSIQARQLLCRAHPANLGATGMAVRPGVDNAVYHDGLFWLSYVAANVSLDPPGVEAVLRAAVFKRPVVLGIFCLALGGRWP